jgi:hypothetical protein
MYLGRITSPSTRPFIPDCCRKTPIWCIFRTPDFIFRKRRIRRESAFVYLVKRITARALSRTNLEDELRQISLERSGTELTALKSRLEPLRKFVATIKKHSEDIITFVECRLTNATAEGLNRIIRMIKNRAGGFRNVTAFIDLIHLAIGDVDIPAQFPQRFRTV